MTRSFIFLAYYPSLAVFAVIFSSFWLSLAWTTAAAVQAPALLNDAVEAILDRRQLVLPACCLIEKCYRNFSTWGPLPTSANSGIAAGPAMGSPAVA